MARRPRIEFAGAQLAVLLLLAVRPLSASEVQLHGLSFEHWVADTFFGGYRPEGATQKWDIPASANQDHGGIPVNPKATKDGSPVGFGDALRQYDINEPFLLIVGFWRQDGETKRFLRSLVARVEPSAWRALWGDIRRKDLLELDRIVKDTSRPIAEVRREVLRRKKEEPFASAAIQVNPKIDRSQRRLQCSITAARLFAVFAPGGPEIFGVPIPPVAGSPPRDLPESAR